MSQTMQPDAVRWDVNGVSLTLNLSDADAMERYENAFEALAQQEQAIPKDGKRSAQIRAYCAMFRKLYDSIFGDGASAKIFANQPDNAEAYDEVYDSFLKFVSAQLVGAAQRRAERLSKYTPNRAARREKRK